MHELGITQEIVAIATEYAGDARVRRIVVEIGRLNAVLPDAVQFCFGVCTEGTHAEGAVLEIIEIPARARCRACAADQVFLQPFGICSSCGATDFDWLSGEELRIRSVEVA